MLSTIAAYMYIWTSSLFTTHEKLDLIKISEYKVNRYNGTDSHNKRSIHVIFNLENIQDQHLGLKVPSSMCVYKHIWYPKVLVYPPSENLMQSKSTVFITKGG